MRGLPTNPHDSFASPAAQVAVGFAMVAAVFAVLVAVAYPGVVVAFALGALSAVAVRRAAGLFACSSGLCVPGTDVCVRWARS